jgi:hypothetical protein
MSVGERAKTKEYIKAGLQGYERSDGVEIPGARRLYEGLSAADGFDLRHIERWTAAKLKSARHRIQSLNTLTSRPFAIIIPRTKKQRKAAQKFTGQNILHQKEFIAQIQIQGRDKAVFRQGKVGIERVFPSGAKTIKQRYLFSDYLRPDETIRDDLSEEEAEEYGDDVLDAPSTFREMREVTQRMLLDMPKNVYGQPAYYALITPQYGAFGRSATHGKVMDLIVEYMTRYDPGGTVVHGRHADFAEHIIGFQMIGTKTQMNELAQERIRLKAMRKERNKLRFSVKRKPTMCPQISSKTSRRCERKIGHRGKHRYPK